jgi:hypothetical protein
VQNTVFLTDFALIFFIFFTYFNFVIMSLKGLMSRWTKPSTQAEKRHYSKYADAIRRYSVGSWVAQGVLGALAFVPISIGLSFTLPAILHPYIPVAATILIVLLHYVLHSEVLELFGNVCDAYDKWRKGSKKEVRESDESDELPKSWFSGVLANWHEWVLPVLIIGVFVCGDIYGGSYTFTNLLYEPKKMNADSLMGDANAKAVRGFQEDTLQINSEAQAGIASASARRNLSYAQSRLIQDAKSRSLETHLADQSYRDAVLEVEKQRKAALKAAKESRDLLISKAQTRVADNENENVTKKQVASRDANNKSWIITVVGWVLFLLMSGRLAILRTRSGIRKQSVFSDLDAEGSTLYKFWVATSSAFKQQGHRFIVGWYKFWTWGVGDLESLNTSVTVTAPVNASPTLQEEGEDDENDDSDVSINVVTNRDTIAPSQVGEGVEREGVSVDLELSEIVTTEFNSVVTELNSVENERTRLVQQDNTMQVETSIGLRTIDSFMDLIRKACERSGGSENDEKLVLRRGELYYYLRGNAAPKMFHWCIRNKAIVGERCYNLSKSALNTMQRFDMDGANDSESES